MRIRAILALVGLSVLLTPVPARAETARADRVVIVVLDRVRVADMLGIPAVRALSEDAAFGVVSVAGRGVVTPFVGALSVSAGTRAVAADPARHFLTVQPGPVRERLLVGTVGQAYRARTGMAPPPADGATSPFVYPDISLVRDANARAEVSAAPGLLGQAAADAGVPRSVASFTDPNIARLAPLVAMDERGVVPWGTLMDRRDPGQAGEAVGRAMARGGLVAVDAGGVGTATLLLPEVVRRLGPDDALVVLATDPDPSSVYQHTWLAPILARGPSLDPGLLTSDSTRRDAVVSNVDLLPTVLAWLGVEEPPGLVGQPLEAVPVDDPPLETHTAFATYARLAEQRGEVFRAISALAIVAMLAAAIAALRGRRRSFAMRAALLASAATPLVMLFEPLLASSDIRVTVSFVLGAAALLGLAAARAFERDAVAFGVLGGATAGLLVLDVLLGSPLGARSLLGFTVAGGTRFYGLASEEMGAALAGMLLFLGLVVDDRPRVRRPAYAAVGLAVLVFAAPPFGAKFGMLLTAVPALATAWVVFERRRMTREIVLLASAMLIAAVGVSTAAGLLAGGGGSHIGIETRVLGEEGVGAAVAVILRRAGVALRLLITFWAWLVAAGIAALAFARWFPRERAASGSERPGRRGVLAGLTVAGAAALLFNDAGAVIVATMVVVAGPAVIAETTASRTVAQERVGPSSTLRRSRTVAASSPSITGAIT